MNIGVPHKLTPCPFGLRIRIKPQAHTTKFTDIPVEFVLCLRFFCGDFCATVAQKHQQNSNKCWAVCIIAAESACHCDEFDKSKFCNLPKVTCLNVAVLKFSSQSIILLFIKRHTHKHTVSYFSRRKRKCLHIGLYSQKRL